MNFKEKAKQVWDSQILDLSDRRGIKQGMSNIDEAVWEEINAIHESTIEHALKNAYELGKAEASELVSALEFYSEKKNWESKEFLCPILAEIDRGKRAREALKKWRGE
jgi:DNA-binding transcriptional ArsR family regulator